MKLAQCKIPHMNVSDAASVGLFNIESGCFDKSALQAAGMDEHMFPFVSCGARLVGVTERNLPVAAAIGDNQASFLGSIKDVDNSILVNVGTGSQISVYSPLRINCPSLETRPFTDEGSLVAGSSLCGGSAYAMLEKFFKSVVNMCSDNEVHGLYDLMDKAAFEALGDADKLEVSTRFKGTRQDPSIRGSITNVGMDNLTPGQLSLGVLTGIAGELYDMYAELLPLLEKKPSILVGSGNGIRKSMLLQNIFAKKFEIKLQIPFYNEEAAYGAALFAMTATGHFRNTAEAQTLIRYK